MGREVLFLRGPERGNLGGEGLFFNEKEILKESDGSFTYREKAIWTRSYFQDSGRNTS